LPFKADIGLISYRYDRNVQFYFETTRFAMMLSIGLFLTFVYFLITHALNFDYTNESGMWCKYNIPCVIFYSRIQEGERQAFSLTYVVATLLFFWLSLTKLISYKKMSLNSELYHKEDTKFSQFFFTSWDWSTKKKSTYMENKRRLRELCRLTFYEVEELTKISHRTMGDKCCRYWIRALSFTLSLIFLIIYAAFIMGAYIIRNYLKSSDKNIILFTPIDIIYEALPAILITVFNLFFPWVFKHFVKMEKWDFQATIAAHMNIRYFIGKVWGLTIIYFVNIYFNLLGNTFQSLFSFAGSNLEVRTFGCPGSYTFNPDNSFIAENPSTYTPINKAYYAECQEDDSVINILFIVIGEFILRKLYDLICFSFLYCCSKKRQIGESYKWPFQWGRATVDNFVFYVQLFAIIPFFPYIIFLTPLLLWAEFKFDVFKLKKLRSKPNKYHLKQENGSLIMILFNVMLLLVIVFNSIFYLAKIPHNYYMECYNTPNGNQAFIGQKLCGPFGSTIPVSSTFVDAINGNKM
jgi:hypothetical protein